MEKDYLYLFPAIDEQIADVEHGEGMAKDALSLVPEIDEQILVVEYEEGVPTDVLSLLPEIDEQTGDVEHEEDVTMHVNANDFEKTLLSKVNELAGSLLGMKASKWEDIFSMYKSHSQHIGFSVIKATSRRAQGVGMTFIERYFRRCSCAGVHGNGRVRSLNDGPEVVRSLTRNVFVSKSKCEAFLRTQVNGDGLWEIVQHIVEHNHPLTLVQWQHHHRSEHKISEAEGEIIKAMSETHVRPSVQFTVAAAVAGGEAFVGHTKRDHNNYVNWLKMRAIECGDAATLINLLTSRQAEKPGFFCVQFDEKGRLSNLFWRDAMMREDYLLYGDVKIFDTTYRTNRYSLICGAFVGINNHWSNVMFGCAFLSNEREESFVWLFNVFNESMGEDVRPVSIFTDQDQAIANAVEHV